MNGKINPTESRHAEPKLRHKTIAQRENGTKMKKEDEKKRQQQQQR